MVLRITVACALFSCLLFTATVSAQPGDRHLDMKARVLDILFPLDVTPKPYFLKMILRFGDSGTPGRVARVGWFGWLTLSTGRSYHSGILRGSRAEGAPGSVFEPGSWVCFCLAL